MEDRGHKLQDGPVEPWKMPIQGLSILSDSTPHYIQVHHTVQVCMQCIPQCTMEIVAIVKTIRLTH